MMELTDLQKENLAKMEFYNPRPWHFEKVKMRQGYTAWKLFDANGNRVKLFEFNVDLIAAWINGDLH